MGTGHSLAAMQYLICICSVVSSNFIRARCLCNTRDGITYNTYELVTSIWMPGFFLLNRGGISEANTAVLQRKQPGVWYTLQHYTLIWLWQHFRIISVGFYLYSLINHIFSNMSNLLIKKALSSEAFWCFLALWSNTVLQGFCKTLLWELCYGKWPCEEHYSPVVVHRSLRV